MRNYTCPGEKNHASSHSLPNYPIDIFSYFTNKIVLCDTLKSKSVFFL